MKTIDYTGAEKVTKICIAGNIALTVFKVIAGVIGNSQAMIADGFHSATDIVATVAVFIGIKIAKKPSDKGHPYGHGKVEPLVASIIGLILTIAGVYILYGVINNLIEGKFTHPTVLALSAALVSIVVKEIMYRVTMRAGKEINSESMVADALHHRSDAFSSIATLIGIGGTMLGDHFNIGVLKYLDPLAALLVAIMIFKIAFDIIRNAISGLMDTAPNETKLQSIREVLLAIDGVKDVSSLSARYIGQLMFVEVTLFVSSYLTVEQGHDIATEAERKVPKYVEDVSSVFVHIEPDMDS